MLGKVEQDLAPTEQEEFSETIYQYVPQTIQKPS